MYYIFSSFLTKCFKYRYFLPTLHNLPSSSVGRASSLSHFAFFIEDARKSAFETQREQKFYEFGTRLTYRFTIVWGCYFTSCSPVCDFARHKNYKIYIIRSQKFQQTKILVNVNGLVI